MYTGQAQRGLGCADCANRPTATGLGIAPAVAALVVQQAPKILSDIEGLFVGSSYDATHQRILQWVDLITKDPTGATSGQYTPGNNSLASAANAYLWLNCAAGNETVLSTYRQMSGDPSPAGCGFETAHGGRADAQTALAEVNKALNQPTPTLSSAGQPITPPPTPLYGSQGTIYSNTGNGSGINIPVPASSLLNATLFGIPVSALALGAVVLAFAGGHRQGGRR